MTSALLSPERRKIPSLEGQCTLSTSAKYAHYAQYLNTKRPANPLAPIRKAFPSCLSATRQATTRSRMPSRLDDQHALTMATIPG